MKISLPAVWGLLDFSFLMLSISRPIVLRVIDLSFSHSLSALSSNSCVFSEKKAEIPSIYITCQKSQRTLFLPIKLEVI